MDFFLAFGGGKTNGEHAIETRDWTGKTFVTGLNFKFSRRSQIRRNSKNSPPGRKTNQNSNETLDR